jgi:7-cyano-7-deazaguanine synthase
MTISKTSSTPKPKPKPNLNSNLTYPSTHTTESTSTPLSKKAVVIHSGGMDSSLCLALAIRDFGAPHILSVSFDYNQRHSLELQQATKICAHWNVDHTVLPIHCLQQITSNALMNSSQQIIHLKDQAPNTLVVGRNGLMARLGAIHADSLHAHCIYMGVINVEGSTSGYRDCSRDYMDLKQELLRIDLGNPAFEIRTPLVFMTKKETMYLGHKLGVLEFLLKETVTCYEGIPLQGCQKCPACFLRNQGIHQFAAEQPNFVLPYPI